MKLFRKLASTLLARETCRETNNTTWVETHSQTLKSLMRYLPSGAGITQAKEMLDSDSTSAKIVLHFSFERYNDNGVYLRAYDFKAIVSKPKDLTEDFNLKIVGKAWDKTVRDDLWETFYTALTEEIN